MTSSNKVRRYLQNHKHHTTVQSLPVESTTSMRKFRGKTQQQTSVPIPQICVNIDDDDVIDDNQHVAILDEFDQVLDSQLKQSSSISRTLSLKQSESTNHIEVPIIYQQQRSYSFALGSKTNLTNDKDLPMNRLSSKFIKQPTTFSRLFQSLTFRSGNNTTSKHSCHVCQHNSNIDLRPKNKKRPSIFGVLVSKLNANSTTNSAPTSDVCSICRKPLAKSNSNNDDKTMLISSTTSHDQNQLHADDERRQSLPSSLHKILETSPQILTMSNHADEQQQQPSSTVSQSSISLTESDDSFEHNTNNNNNNNNPWHQRPYSHYDESSKIIEKQTNQDQNEHDITIFNGEHIPIEKKRETHIHTLSSSDDPSDLTIMNSNHPTNEHNTNQQFLQPPEDKSRNLSANAFRTRRTNIVVDSTDTNMVGKQLSASVINLATSIAIHRRNSAIPTIKETAFDPQKHTVSEENLLSTDNNYIYFTNINGQNFKERLKYSTVSEHTTLREMLTKLFEKYNLSIETCNIYLRTAPTLPLSLDQPVKHLLLDDLVVTEAAQRLAPKTSNGKDKVEKRNSIGSAILSFNSKSISKRLSAHCMMLENDENQESKATNPTQQLRPNKTSRSSLFTASIFNRDTSDSPETNLSFIRRKCDEWLVHGLPKLAQMQYSIDEFDLTIEKEWQPFLNEESRTQMSEAIKLQQEAIYEMLSTEVSYIRQISTMIDVFMTSINILKSSQRDGIFNDIDMDKLFSNIKDVLHGNLLFWKQILLPIRVKLQQTGLPMNPSDLKHGFMNFEFYFKPYLHYVLDQKASADYFKQRFSRDDLFQHLITWIEANFTNRLSYSDLTIKPLQRLTRYKLLLEAILKKTIDMRQKNDLQEMIHKVATFVNRVNSKLHNQEQEERVRHINERIGAFDNISAPTELTSMLQEYNRDLMMNRLNLLQDMPLYVRGYRRQIIQQGPMKMKDSKNSQDVYCYLFTDMFLITKGSKRNGSTNSSSLSAMSNESQTNRTAPTVINKILKSPIRIDRIDVREYERRGGSSSTNSEPHTASFVAIVFSEYNLIENAYIFQTNLSKQWIENIRRAKSNFHLLMEESKMRFQNLHHRTTTSICSTATTTNTIHQSLPSLSLPLAESPSSSTINDANSLSNETSRLSKVESNVFKIVEQTRRNSRSDRKNFGRYFTADGTSTNGTTSAPSPIKQMLSSSTTVIKRMSWNNDQSIEKNDSSLKTNSFRSVHSSSGVSSTGSFLFSADEDSSITTTSSSMNLFLPANKHDEFDSKSLASTVIEIDDPLAQSSASSLLIQPNNSVSEDSIENHTDNEPSTNHLSSPSATTSNNSIVLESTPTITTDLSSPESSLRRIPYPSVRKRNQTHFRSALHQQAFRRYKIHNTNDIDDDHTTVHSPVDDSLLVSSGNESDYDNNQCSTNQLPVNDLLTSNDDNETHAANINNNPSSDTTTTQLHDTSHKTHQITTVNPAITIEDTVPSDFQAFRKDSLAARRLLDIRSHLLLNTTLDATEV